MRILLMLIFCFCAHLSFSQIHESVHPYNFGFEDGISSNQIPKGWRHLEGPNYTYVLDSVIKHSGKYSLCVQTDKEDLDNVYSIAATKINNSYKGKKIKVRGYMKFSDIKLRVGLYVRINKKDTILRIESMMKSDILKGNKDWALYSVNVPIDDDAATIYIGAVILGTGKLWLDDFQVFIDGHNVDQSK